MSLHHTDRRWRCRTALLSEWKNFGPLYFMYRSFILFLLCFLFFIYFFFTVAAKQTTTTFILQQWHKFTSESHNENQDVDRKWHGLPLLYTSVYHNCKKVLFQLLLSPKVLWSSLLMSYIHIQSQSHRITKDLLSENKLFLSLNWLQCMFFFTYFAIYGMGQDLSLNLLSAKRSRKN